MPKIKISVGELKKIMSESLGKPLNESEIFVDDEGYAHDDEGNTWFVGKYAQRGVHGGTKFKDPSWSHSWKSKQSKYSRTPTSQSVKPQASTASENAVKQLLLKRPDSNFVKSVHDQVVNRKQDLSQKQKDVVSKMLKSFGLDDVAKQLV